MILKPSKLRSLATENGIEKNSLFPIFPGVSPGTITDHWQGRYENQAVYFLTLQYWLNMKKMERRLKKIEQLADIKKPPSLIEY